MADESNASSKLNELGSKYAGWNAVDGPKEPFAVVDVACTGELTVKGSYELSKPFAEGALEGKYTQTYT